MSDRSSFSEYENSIYHDAKRYDDEHWWKTDDIDFWRSMFREAPGNKILELAAGTGRIGLPLLKEGADYTGIEISHEFCDQARHKLSIFGELAKIKQGDIREFQLGEKFDLIYIGFNSFLHLLNDEDAMACLNCVRHHLNPGGRFMIDIFIPNPLFLYRPEGVRYPTMEYRDSESGGIIRIEETNQYEPVTGINSIRWYYISEDGSEEVFDFTMRMLWPDTMNRLLIDAGFEIEAVWGDYERTPVSEDSNLHIYVCRLP